MSDQLETFTESRLKLCAHLSVAPPAVRFRLMEPFALVYFCQSIVGGPIKVGLTDHPWRRLSALQIGNPYRLRFVGFLPGDRADEQALHEVFASARLRGEWFHPTPDLTGFVNAEASPSAWERFPSGERSSADPREMLRDVFLARVVHDQSVAPGTPVWL